MKRRRGQTRIPHLWLVALAWTPGCRGDRPAASPPPPDGAALARQHCARCHLAPEPALLPRPIWPHVLNVMGLYLGHDDAGLRPRLAADPMLRRQIDVEAMPAGPLISAAEWQAIRTHFASGPLAPRLERPTAEPLLQFETSPVFLDVPAPIVALAHVDAGGLVAGEATTRSLRRFDRSLQRFTTTVFAAPPLFLLDRPDGQELALTPAVEPSESKDGALVRLRGPEAPPEPVLGGLARLACLRLADLDGDGDDDRLTCEFGHQTGALSWHERTATGFTRHVLIDRPGAVGALVRDFDGDGHTDVLALMAQAREGLYLARGRGGGRFEVEALLEKPPTFGYVDLAEADLDADGRPELLVLNGDNGDLPGPPPRPDHGLRIYAFDGRRLEERAWHPFAGGFRFVSGDFDADADLDLALVSFFPLPDRPAEAFLYLENLGGLRFTRRELPPAVAAAGHWMSLTAGDADADGDLDLVLGAGYPELGGRAPARPLPALLVLRNRRLSPKAP